jgi:hypothetical protein
MIMLPVPPLNAEKVREWKICGDLLHLNSILVIDWTLSSKAI